MRIKEIKLEPRDILSTPIEEITLFVRNENTLYVFFSFADGTEYRYSREIKDKEQITQAIKEIIKDTYKNENHYVEIENLLNISIDNLKEHS